MMHYPITSYGFQVEFLGNKFIVKEYNLLSRLTTSILDDFNVFSNDPSIHPFSLQGLKVFYTIRHIHGKHGTTAQTVDCLWVKPGAFKQVQYEIYLLPHFLE